MKYHAFQDPIRSYNLIFGGKWRLLILQQLFESTQRFGELKDKIEGITPRMLTKELSMLIKYNLIEKEVYREVPPRVEYSLTDDGVSLFPLIELIVQTGEKFAQLTESTIKSEPTFKKEREFKEKKPLKAKRPKKPVSLNQYKTDPEDKPKLIQLEMF